MADKKKQTPMYEAFRLKLEHFMTDGKDEFLLEEPLCVQVYFDRENSVSAYALNEVLDRLCREAYKRAGV